MRKEREQETSSLRPSVLPRPGDDLFPLCPLRAGARERTPDVGREIKSAVYASSYVLPSSPPFEVTRDSRIDRGSALRPRGPTLISSDRLRLEAASEKRSEDGREGAERVALCMRIRWYRRSARWSLVRNAAGCIPPRAGSSATSGRGV